MTEPNVYEALFAEIVAEWRADEDAEYRRFYPDPQTPKENDR